MLILQNRAMRIIFKIKPRDSTQTAMDKIKVLPLDHHRALQRMQLVRWIRDCGILADKRNLPTRAHALDRHTLTIRKPRNAVYQKLFLHRACLGWNSLPTDLHNLDDTDLYKNRINELIRENKLVI